MSRSHQKTPIRGNTKAESEKQDKQHANRKFRRIVRQKMKAGKDTLPQIREVSNVWTFDKDGKTYDKSMDNRDLRK